MKGTCLKNSPFQPWLQPGMGSYIVKSFALFLRNQELSSRGMFLESVSDTGLFGYLFVSEAERVLSRIGEPVIIVI